MKEFEKTADMHAQEANSGRTALHKAAFWGHIETVTYLLDECKLEVCDLFVGMPNRGTLEYGKAGRGIGKYQKNGHLKNLKNVI